MAGEEGEKELPKRETEVVEQISCPACGAVIRSQSDLVQHNKEKHIGQDSRM